MSDVSNDETQRQAERLLNAWRTPTGWRYLSAVNNTEVGKWYMLGSFVFLFFGGALALLIRLQLAAPNQTFVSQPLYDQLFTMHGSVMMFLFAVPVFEAFAILMLPEMLGARDLPLPRLSAFGFWCFAIGGVFFCGCLFFGIAPSGGWFMYPPLTSDYQTDSGPDIWLLGLSFIEIASISAAVELIVGVLRCRPPGMKIHLTPLYGWYVLVVGAMILFAFPPLIAGDVLLELERALSWPFFDATRGGDPLLWQHLFWIFGHPEVYIVFLPSVALVAMMVPTFVQRPMVGYSGVVLSAVGVGFLSFGLWVHHMFTTGLPGMTLGFFSAASEAVAIPTGIQFLCFIATLLAGRVQRSVAMLFVVGSFATFVLGGLTGVMVAMVPFDLQAHDSYFIVAHLHSVLIGGTLFPILGAFYYYFPLIRGKFLSERLGRLAFWLLFIGFNVTFLPMHVTGMRGMPRRVYTYAADLGLESLNLTSTIGAFVLALGFLVFAFDVLRPKGHQPDAPANPWNGGTLEWVSKDNDKPWGVRSIPHVTSRYPLWDQPSIVDDVAEGRGYLPDAEEGLRETLVTTAVDAEPVLCLRVGTPTFTTLVAAATLGGSFIFATFYWWWTALAFGIAATGAILYWLWTGTALIPERTEKDVGHGVTVPTYVSGTLAVGWWGLLLTMLADATAFISLIFGYFYYFTVHDGYPPADHPHPDTTYSLAALALLVLAGAATFASQRFNRRDQGSMFYGALTLGALAAVAGAIALVLGLRTAGLDPTSHVYPAIVWTLVLWTVAHIALGVLMQGYCLARRLAGRMTARFDADITNVTLYWYFATATAVTTILVIVGMPEAT